MTEPTGRFRVLALDGGGIKGVFTASLLAGIEEMTGKRIVDHFDLIAGTSTGGIIALGLGLGLSANEILGFYLEHADLIFSGKGLWARARQLIYAKHDLNALRTVLTRILGDKRLGDARTRLVIPAFSAVEADIHIFKTAHHERLRQDYMLPAVDVALATAAAPTFFSPFESRYGERLIDGGIWANCPAAIAAVEAMTLSPGCAVHILSIGTTANPLWIPRDEGKRGFFGWLRKKRLFDFLMEGQKRGALGMAGHLAEITGGGLLRIDKEVGEGRFSLDDPRQVEDLQALGRVAARHWTETILKRFLDEAVERFVPIHPLPRIGSKNGRREASGGS